MPAGFLSAPHHPSRERVRQSKLRWPGPVLAISASIGHHSTGANLACTHDSGSTSRSAAPCDPCRRTAPGVDPTIRVNARLNAASER